MESFFVRRSIAHVGGLALVGASMLACLVGCSGSSSGDAGTDAPSEASVCTAPGGPVTGTQDSHCASDGSVTQQMVDLATCHPDGGGTDEDAGDDGGDDYGATNFNATASDDDCKYQVTFTSTPICESSDVTFTVTATYAVGGGPVHGAAIRAEVFLSETHPGPNTQQVVTESGAGIYTVGPVRFDASGMWTVRFHLFEDCTDGDESPHGHAAFFVNVP